MVNASIIILRQPSYCTKSASMDVAQCRMARAALRWSLDDLAAASGVARRSVARFEAGETVRAETVAEIRAALEAKGVRFFDSGKLAGGVVYRHG
ncbi:MAG: helix-turn-helix domain-containing protein [Parasphingopyxis sp.]